MKIRMIESEGTAEENAITRIDFPTKHERGNLVEMIEIDCYGGTNEKGNSYNDNKLLYLIK